MMEHWGWADWYMLEHKEHPITALRRWAIGRGLRIAIAFAVGVAVGALL
jgi:hypothetical protein